MHKRTLAITGALLFSQLVMAPAAFAGGKKCLDAFNHILDQKARGIAIQGCLRSGNEPPVAPLISTQHLQGKHRLNACKVNAKRQNLSGTAEHQYIKHCMKS
ncbi:MAG: hypothetical protein KDE68_13365 [Rhodocyclaceae bacterium]|nr:hypothetical protein [Rhodocyclaceae bacterium]